MSQTLKPIIFSNITQFQTIQNKLNKYSISFPKHSPHTKQEFLAECDINTIMARYQSTGEMPVINQVAPQYLDVVGADFQNSMEFVAGAQTLFMDLPSKLRTRFGNDPAQFLDFCSNEANRAEMQALGLLKTPISGPSGVPPTPTPTNPPETPKSPASP